MVTRGISTIIDGTITFAFATFIVEKAKEAKVGGTMRNFVQKVESSILQFNQNFDSKIVKN
jgi:hypothetical protein